MVFSNAFKCNDQPALNGGPFVAVNDRKAFGLVDVRGAGNLLICVTRDGNGIRYHSLGSYKNAANKPTRFAPYDPNKALRLSGLKEMTEE